MTDTVPDLSIMVLVDDHTGHLGRTLGQLRTQTVQNFELLIVDQRSPSGHAAAQPYLVGSTAFDEDWLAAVPPLGLHPLVHLRMSGQGAAFARNKAVERARGRIILFLRADVLLLSDRFLEEHLEPYREADIGGVGGRTVERFGYPNASYTVAKITLGGRRKFNLLGVRPTRLRVLGMPNMSLRTEVFRYVDGFDPAFDDVPELADADLTMRVEADGWRFVFAPPAELLHTPARIPTGEAEGRVEREARRFRATAHFVRKNRGWLGLIPFLSTFSLIALRRVVQWRDPAVPGQLARAIIEGWRLPALRQQAVPAIFAQPQPEPWHLEAGQDQPSSQRPAA